LPERTTPCAAACCSPPFSCRWPAAAPPSASRASAGRRTWRRSPTPPPTPGPQEPPLSANSLWRPGSRTFLRDQRAAQVGDLVTVLVSIQDEAELQNSTERTRDNSETLGIPRLLGLDASYLRFFPNSFDPTRMVEGNSAAASAGDGSIRRNETVTLRLAATVTQVLANGNLVVAGRQQVRVNHEMRDLSVAGVLRPSDIASDNTIRHDRLAEARISYGGRGTVSDVQQPRYGQQILDAILPF
jgi:flagellar L-ring protein precursor FlgH